MQTYKIARQSTYLQQMLRLSGSNYSSVAFNIRSRFEDAYKKKMAQAEHQEEKIPEAQNMREYGQSYYQQNLENMKVGYVHPYHSEKYPMFFSHLHYMRTLFESVGPEQVSPHYESLSRSRRGIIFFYFYLGSIVSLAQLGGWSHNEWLRGMIFHHEFLIAFYLGVQEIRHFTFFLGPKFSVFYNVYTRYEAMQLFNQWSDTTEELQLKFLADTKSQIEFTRLNSEYDFIKKRSLINYLTNEKLNLEQHFYSRTVSMLGLIKQFEEQNMKNHLQKIAQGSMEALLEILKDESQKLDIQEQSFKSALRGIEEGSMRYQSDPLLPLLQDEIKKRVEHFQNLSKEEESKLLSLTIDQKRIVGEQDKKVKQEYLLSPPNINNPGVKGHEKYKQFLDLIQSLQTSEVAKQ